MHILIQTQAKLESEVSNLKEQHEKYMSEAMETQDKLKSQVIAK